MNITEITNKINIDNNNEISLHYGKVDTNRESFYFIKVDGNIVIATYDLYDEPTDFSEDYKVFASDIVEPVFEGTENECDDFVKTLFEKLVMKQGGLRF